MSRLEKTLERKNKNRKFRTIGKMVFVCFLIANTMVCVYIVDLNAKKMLGKEIHTLDNVNKIQIYVKNIMSNIEEASLNIKQQFNNSIK